jgi:hypothetical protein
VRFCIPELTTAKPVKKSVLTALIAAIHGETLLDRPAPEKERVATEGASGRRETQLVRGNSSNGTLIVGHRQDQPNQRSPLVSARA